MSQPNVLMIVVDCLRSDRIFGDDRTCKTPTVDRLAARGVGVPNLFVENSTTAPAFGNIFTGCYSLYHGVTALLGVQMNPEPLTLAEAFAASGYHTYAEVTGPMMPLLKMGRGFQTYNYRDHRDYFFSRWGEDLIRRFESGAFDGPWFTLVHFWELHEPRQVVPAFDAPEWGATGYDRAMSGLDEYIGRLTAAAGDDAVVVLTGDHGERIDETTAADSILPYFMKKLKVNGRAENESRMDEDIELLNRKGNELHEVSHALSAHTREHGGRIDLRPRVRLMVRLVAIGLTRFRLQKSAPGFRGFVEALRMKVNDLRLAWNVARGRSEVAQLHLLRTTLSQFHLEHGFHIYEYLSRVPLLVAGWEGATDGRLVEAEARNIDLMPTLCELFGLAADTSACHGSSFVEELTGGVPADRPLYMEVRGGAEATHAFYIRGVRAGGFKLAYAPLDPEAPTELFDLAVDPRERRNVVGEHWDVVARLRDEGEAMAGMFQSGFSGSDFSDEDDAETIEKLRALGYM